MKSKKRLGRTKYTFIKSKEAYRACIEMAMRGEHGRKNRRKRFPLWWHDGTEQRSILLGEFGTIVELFNMVEAHLGGEVDSVYCCSTGNSRFDKDYSREIYVRQDGQVFFSMVQVGGNFKAHPKVPLNPTETSYDYVPVVPCSAVGITYEKVRLPLL
ncbi:MAG: hypothetical protein CMP20_10485 [Rickettsiales bacterium]|nr:hypothetical protein [Rickettsiales bacterium]